MYSSHCNTCIFNLCFRAPGTAHDQTCPQGLPLPSVPVQSYITHFWKPSTTRSHPSNGNIDLTQYSTVTLLESRTMIEGGTTGLRTWGASFVLSQYLISHPGDTVPLISMRVDLD